MIHLHRGTLELMRQNNEQAIPHLQRAIQLKPGYSEAYNNLGVALARLGRLEEALAAHRQAYVADAENFTALYNVGATQEKLGRPDEAARSFEELADRAPRSVRARVRLSRLAYARGDAATGERWRREVLALDPANMEVRQFGVEVKNDN
jgi:Flp pilus assembly protein TadD